MKLDTDIVYMEHSGGTKFYEVSLFRGDNTAVVVVRYGRLGTLGTVDAQLMTSANAVEWARTQIKNKERREYKRVGSTIHREGFVHKHMVQIIELCPDHMRLFLQKGSTAYDKVTDKNQDTFQEFPAPVPVINPVIAKREAIQDWGSW